MPLSSTIDVVALVRLLKRRVVEIKKLKRQLRSTWTRPMAAEQERLLALKLQITSLCILRAHLRGRFHIARPPMHLRHLEWNQTQYHQQMAERTAETFELGELS